MIGRAGRAGRNRRRAIFFLFVTVVAGMVPGTGAEGATVRETLWRGVTMTHQTADGPLDYWVVRIEPDAAVDLQPVISNGRIGEGKETVDRMCGRLEAIACVNANFPDCFRCSSPFGAVVQNRRLLSTPAWHQAQVVVRDGRLAVDSWEWTAFVEARVPRPVFAPEDWEPPRLALDDVNVTPRPDSIVLLTRHWGTETRTPPGTFEVSYRGPQPLWTGTSRQRVEILARRGIGNQPIPSDGGVLVGTGDGFDRLKAFFSTHAAFPIDLVAETPTGLTTAISGHPVLLRDGERAPLDPADGKVVRDHPRTLIGWDDLGTTWLVVVDGRSQASVGLDLYESTDLLVDLGATNAVNLDGGGSTTLSTWCAGVGWCVRNQPSDGKPRPVPIGLAIRPRRS